MSRVLLEITVDKNNQKGLFAAEQILNVLHNSQNLKKLVSKEKKQENFVEPVFSFEIVNYLGNTKFFIEIPKEYKEFLENQIYAHFPNSIISENKDYLEFFEQKNNLYVGNVTLSKDYLFPIKTIKDFYVAGEKEFVDPYSSITSTLNKQGNDLKFVQFIFSPVSAVVWQDKSKIQKIVDTKLSTVDKFKNSVFYKTFKVLVLILTGIRNFILFLFYPKVYEELKAKTRQLKQKEIELQKKEIEKEEEKNPQIKSKLSSKLAYKTAIKIGCVGDEISSSNMINEISSTLSMFNIEDSNSFKLEKIENINSKNLKKRKIEKDDLILTTEELAGLVHIPTGYIKTPGISWLNTKFLEPPGNLPTFEKNKNLLPIGVTNFRGGNIKFGIGANDRRRHLYIVGKTGTGKSTLIENMIFDDISKGNGVALLDPHGDLADNILRNIPKSRTNDVVIFDPSDFEYPVAFNLLENVSKELRPLVASGLIGVFKKLFDSWGPRLEYILRNTILTLLGEPDATLMNIPTILTNESYRQKVVSRLKDPVLLKFWQDEFEPMDRKQKIDAISPILNKVGQFLSSSVIRNILGQPKNSFSLRWIMDKKKILIVNLSKGKIGEDYSSLLGSLIVTKFQIDAMGRANISEDERQDFYLYVDEFQNFATESFATILSEARKYKLNLTLANQYIGQMSAGVKDAIFGNVGSIVSFQTGYEDAGILCENMGGSDIGVIPADYVNLRKYDVYIKQYIDGVPSNMFSATTLPPIKFKKNTENDQNKDTLIKVNREKYAKKAEFVEQKILEFSDKVTEMKKKDKENKKMK